MPADPRSETAEYEALDEDRMFHADTDFIEPVAVPAQGDAQAPEETSEPSEGPASIDDQATQPIDPLER